MWYKSGLVILFLSTKAVLITGKNALSESTVSVNMCTNNCPTCSSDIVVFVRPNELVVNEPFGGSRFWEGPKDSFCQILSTYLTSM